MESQKITPFLWFEKDAEEAVNFYISIFKNSKITATTRYPKETEEVSGQKSGTVMTIDFEIEGQMFSAINGGPAFKINQAISFVIRCKNQEEVDYYWEKLSDGGEEQQCGWVIDKFGVAWQVTPEEMLNFIADGDPVKVGRAMGAMLKMVKLDIAELRKAYEGK